MSQLYKLRRGGVGHFDEAWQEDLVIMMEFLTIEEIISFVKQLKYTIAVYSNDTTRLEEARSVLLRRKKLTINDINKALKIIADVAYSKVFFSDSPWLRFPLWQGAPNKTIKTIIKSFKEKAVARGYKEESDEDIEESEEDER